MKAVDISQQRQQAHRNHRALKRIASVLMRRALDQVYHNLTGEEIERLGELQQRADEANAHLARATEEAVSRIENVYRAR